MPTNRTAELQLRGRAGTLQGRVYWPGPSLARPARLLVFWTVAGGGTWCQELSARAGLVVLAVTCGRPYPTDLDDAVTTAEWAAENTARLGADPGELLVGGPARGARSPPRSRCMRAPPGGLQSADRYSSAPVRWSGCRLRSATWPRQRR
jgi:alpha/beta hydrolase fold